MTKILGRRVTDAEAAVARVESLLGELVARMTEKLVEAKAQVALAKKEESQLAKQAEVAARAAEQWGQHGMSAARARDDVVARDALVRKHACERAAAEFRAALESQRAEVERMTAALNDESARVEDAKHRRNAIVLRAGRAGAEASIAEALREAKSPELLDRLESALSVLDREAAVARELSERTAPRAKKPLAKTIGSRDGESSRARAGASPARRTKR